MIAFESFGKIKKLFGILVKAILAWSFVPFFGGEIYNFFEI